jgi:PAS domain S-box-containing protein
MANIKINSKGFIVEADSVFGDMFGISVQDIIGSNYQDFQLSYFKGFQVINEQESRFYIAHKNQLSFIVCSSKNSDASNTTSLAFNLIDTPNTESETWKEFNTSFQKICSFQSSKIAFVDIHGATLWMNEALLESKKSQNQSNSEITFAAIQNQQKDNFNSDLFVCWIKGTTHSAVYKLGANSVELFFTAYEYENDALAGFKVELKELPDSEPISSNKELSNFPLKNPFPVFKLNSKAELQFANAPAMINFCNKDGKLKKDYTFQFQTIIQSFSDNEESKTARVEVQGEFFLTVFQKVDSEFNVYCSDITELVKSEKKNEENIALLDAIVNSSSNSIILLNKSRRVSYFNQKAKIESRRHFGYQLVLGEMLPDFEETGFSKTLDRSVDAVFNGGKQVSFDIELNATAESLWFNFNVFPVMSNAGTVNSVCLNILNITRSKNSEIEIRDTKKFYETILNNIPSDIAVFDLNQNYLFLNPIAVKDEKVRKWLIGKNDYDYFRYRGLNTDIADKRREVFQQTVQGKKTNEVIDFQIKADGNPQYTLRRFYPYYENNELKLVIGYGLDISEIKAAQAQSKLVENKFKSLFENNPMFLFILDENYQVISANISARTRFDIKENEMPGFLFLDLIESSSRSEFQSKFSQAFTLEMNQSQSCYCQLERNNNVFTVEFSATPVISGAGEKHLLLAGADQTERIKNQERLRLSEEFNRKLINSMPVPFAIIDWDKAEFINQAFRDLVELEPNEDFTGKSLYEFIHLDDYPVFKKKLEDRYNGLKRPPVLIKIVTRNNNQKYIEAVGGLMAINEREVNFVTFTDKTLEIIEGRARNTAELRTKQIIETALDAVITTNSKGEIQDWNPKAEQIFGWKASEAKGRNINETIIPSGMRHMHNSGMDRHLATGESRVLNRPLELSAITKMGKEFPVELFITRFEVEGEILFSSFIRDITDRKAAQEALLESESKLSILVNTLPVVPYTTQFNANYSFSYISDRIETLFGYNTNEVLKSDDFWVSHIFEDDLYVFKEGQKELLETGEANIQYRIHNAEGKLIWVRDSMRLVLSDKAGDPYLVTGVFQDVTQLIEEEERRKLIDKTLFEISRQELSAKQSLRDFYALIFEILHKNVNISRMSIWEMNRSDNKANCLNYYSSIKEDDHSQIGAIISLEEIAEKLKQSNIIYSNSSEYNVLDGNLINSVFNKTDDISLLFCLIKAATNENHFILIETDQPNFKWEYEHLNLVNSISELVSVNIEYFNRIETDGKLREAYKMAKIGAWEIDRESNRSIWSESMFEFYNLPAKDSKPLNFNQALEYHHPEDRAEFVRLYANLIDKLEPYQFICRHLFPNGELKYFEKSAMARKNALNKITFMGVTVDITEKKLAEIEQERIKIKQLLSNTLGARISNIENQDELLLLFSNLLIETKFIKDCCLIVNQNAQNSESTYVIKRVFPNKKASISLEKEVHLIMQENFVGNAKVKASTLKSTSKETVFGSIKVFGLGDAFMLYHLMDDGNSIESKMDILDELIKMVHEKSERIYSESQVKELNVELLDTNIQLRQYSFIVSHNLRAPIANILGCLNIFNEDDPNDPKNKKLLNGLKVSANSVDGILQDLNKILNIKENVSKQYEFVSFEKTLDLVLDSIRRDMMEVDFELISDFSKLEGLRSFRPYLVSIFQNILSNSFKYREPSRKLVVTIVSATDGEKSIIKFSDNGRGIDLEKHGSRIFKLYSRFHSDVAGTGIGLNMVKEQARVMGGSIHIESKIDEGTTFTFTFVNKK